MTRSFPGFIDVHVHFRDPGLPEAETNETGLAAARKGGMAAVVAMPNTTPAGDSVAWVKGCLEKGILPSACITQARRGEKVADLERLAEAGAVFFTDDGSYVANDRVMEEAMSRAYDLNMTICQHAMDPKVQAGGVIRDCPLARKLNLPIISPETETTAIKRDLSLCRTTGCRLHIQHISTAQGVDLVRSAQNEGLPVTAEATPHHLLLSCDDLTVDDANFKMAPPLGTHEDRAEIRKGVKDGVLMFATDHAPHPASKKSLGFLKSANGIIGLETAIPITYEVMVVEERMPIEAWARAWHDLPGYVIANFKALEPTLRETTVEIGAPRSIDISTFVSRSRNCPYQGRSFTCFPLPL